MTSKLTKELTKEVLRIAREQHEHDSEIHKMWKDAGGYFHGPHVEHAVMIYSKWLPFMREFAERCRKERDQANEENMKLIAEAAELIKPTADDTRLIHPVTGDTWVIDKNTGRVKEVIPHDLLVDGAR